MSEPVSQIPNLGPFVLLQGMVGLTFAGFFIFVWLRGEKKKNGASESSQPSGGVSLFFDGPLKVITDTLQGIYRRQGEAKEEISEGFKELRNSQERATAALHELLVEFVRSGGSVRRRRRRR